MKRYVHHSSCILLIVAVTILAVTGVQAKNRPESSCITTGWPSERSDLLPDPSLARGTLPNGVRYVVMPNDEPEDRVAIYLAIEAGSFHEKESQRGIAHFLEHMMFNGTTHFPPGELVRFFQSIGMSFGGDTNAHTSFDETVYKIHLPTGSEENLRNGLQVMADYGRGALLLQSEVERERGIILSEKLARDSASYRAYVARNQFVMAGTLMPERLVIGELDVLQNADRDLLKSFYDAWYRPENMLLVVVGKTSPAEVIPLIQEYFSPLEGASVEYSCPDFGQVSHSGLETWYYHEPDLGRTDIGIQAIWNEEPENDSFELQKKNLIRYASMFMLNKRFAKAEEEGETGFSSAGYYAGKLFDHVGYASINARSDAEQWEQAFEKIATILKQALEYGFEGAELDIFKKEMIASLETAVLTKDSRASQGLAMEIIRQFNDNRVFQSPEQEKALYSSVVENLNMKEIEQQFRRDWSHGATLVAVNGTAVLDPQKAEDILREKYLALQDRKTKPYQAASQGNFPYLKMVKPDPSSIAEVVPHDEIGAMRYVFANNVVVNLKPNRFEPNRIRVLVNIGEGRFSEPKPGMSIIAEDTVNDSGTGTLTRSEFSDILAGSTLKVDFRIREDSFQYIGESVSEEGELLFQVLHTLMADPALRESAYTRAMDSQIQMYERLRNEVDGPLRIAVPRFFAGGNRKIGLPDEKSVISVTLEDLQNWILPALKGGSVEVNIVGDFEPGLLEAQVLRYFGGLSKRLPVRNISEKLNFPDGEMLEVEVDTEIEKSILTVAWPTEDFRDIGLTRRLHMLAQVFKDRLREIVREKLGATYSPTVFNMPGKIHEGYGKMVVQLTVKPGDEEKVLAEITEIAEDLSKNGIQPEELAMVQKPLLTSIKDSTTSNRYWLYSVLSQSSRYPEKLEWPLTMERDYAAIGAVELSKIAQKYLRPDRMATAIVKPAKKGGGA